MSGRKTSKNIVFINYSFLFAFFFRLTCTLLGTRRCSNFIQRKNAARQNKEREKSECIKISLFSIENKRAKNDILEMPFFLLSFTSCALNLIPFFSSYKFPSQPTLLTSNEFYFYFAFPSFSLCCGGPWINSNFI